ncbi:MAG: hypothetical protein GFH27_549297n33 [Chloroflexi bacterium AL-W]|nr:hypothetical protein [Chloroflexi bacterium AL-N1]NOK68559.1 hypothetical protein [Chloroflexi bacterium AL-N10]NOK76045.1 hypothetical protein [Chloroflexi bacterium AL-N5]NOK82516.1 hypothetical protein [Chloroflexi bacterium AL-W]NOK92828.1 hypothetical protein [Chloroflexi bacterium AL-N15]
MSFSTLWRVESYVADFIRSVFDANKVSVLCGESKVM